MAYNHNKGLFWYNPNNKKPSKDKERISSYIDDDIMYIIREIYKEDFDLYDKIKNQ